MTVYGLGRRKLVSFSSCSHSNIMSLGIVNMFCCLIVLDQMEDIMNIDGVLRYFLITDPTSLVLVMLFRA